VIWLDILDTPLVGFLDTVFRENYPETTHPITRSTGTDRARDGTGKPPTDFMPDHAPSSLTSHLYARAHAALECIEKSANLDICHGFKMQYTNPATGAPATPTMGAFLQCLPKGFLGIDYRSTESTIICVAEGHGRTRVDNLWIDWGPADVFTLPGWQRYHHETADGAVLFSVSERPVQQTLGLWREERFDAST